MTTSDYKIGEKVRITKTLYDGGDEFPYYVLVENNQLVTIRKIFERYLVVVHSDDPTYEFRIFEGEFVPTFDQ